MTGRSEEFMKRSMNAQEQALRAQSRRRMIGAAVIMLGVITLLPMILDHSMEPKLSAHGLSEEQMNALHNRGQFDPVPTTARPDLPQPAAPPEVVTAPAPVAPAAPPVERLTSPETAAVPAPAPSGSKTAFWVQVGVFKDRGKAQALVKKLADHEIHAVGEDAHYKEGVRVRVRVGPFSNKTEALAMTRQLEQLSLKSMVIAP